MPVLSKCAFILFFILLSNTVLALSTDFEDLTLGQRFEIGETISSRGLEFIVVDFSAPGGRFLVAESAGQAAISGLSLSTGNAALDFPIPTGTNYVSLLYDIDAGATLSINGIETLILFTFTNLNGSSIGGIDISVTPLTPPDQEVGILTLSGPLDSFVIGGAELSLDDVTIQVPEPATAFLLAAGCAMIMSIRSRRRRS